MKKCQAIYWDKKEKARVCGKPVGSRVAYAGEREWSRYEDIKWVAVYLCKEHVGLNEPLSKFLK